MLSEDTEHLFAEYTGGVSQVIPYTTKGITFISGTCMTDDVYYWLDDSGAATPEQAARELITVMLEDIKNRPEDERSFTLLEYSVKEQTLYAWEDLPSLFYDAEDTQGMTLEQAVDMISEDLDYDKRSYVHPFDWRDFSYALGPDMWTLDLVLTFDYEGVANMYWRDEAESFGLIADDGLVMEVQQGSEAMFDYIIIRMENVWRMQRAGAMESIFSDCQK